MKDYLINNKILFFIPFLFTLFLFLNDYSNCFVINGTEYEFLFSEFIIILSVVFIIQFILILILSRFISNKNLLFIDNILISLILYGKFKLIIVLLLFKKENINISISLEIISALLSCFIVFLSLTSIITIITKGISFTSRINHYNHNKKISIDNSKKSPNIYWIHMDGMPNTNFIKTKYKKDLSEYEKYFTDMNFIENEKATFHGGHHTITALNSLINPEYYDNFLKDYLEEYDKYQFTSKKTKKTANFKDLSYHRINSELIRGLKQKGYSTVSVAYFNQYTSLNTDYVYDLLDDESSCEIAYFRNKYNTKEIYNNVLKTHFKYVLSKYYNIPITSNSYHTKRIKCKDTTSTKKNQDYSLKKTITALDDIKNKDNKPKFYFIVNNLMHRYWNYDQEGNYIKKDNTNLDDYDDCYIYTMKVLIDLVKYINNNDSQSVIIIQGDHGIHVLDAEILKSYFKIDNKEVLNIRNSSMNLIYIPKEYQNGDELYLRNPLNISRYIMNNYVGNNYIYLKTNGKDKK